MRSSIRILYLLVCSLVAIPVLGAAQTVVSDPNTAEFNPSPDHATIDANGQPLVSRYDLQFFMQGASQPFQTASLGKPAPDPDGLIRVNLATAMVPLPTPGLTYEARVAAVGPGGTSPSDPSNPFVFVASISPTSSAVGAGAATGSVAVAMGGPYAWAATSQATWLTITSGASGVGSGTVSYAVGANPSTGTRTGTLTIASQLFTVTQSGQTCTFAISPTTTSVGSGATTGSVSVTAGGGCSWTATSNAGWITITSGASGSGNGSVGYSVGTNSTTSPRTGTITIAGQTFTVTQSGTSCTYSISPTSASSPAQGGTGSVAVSASGGCSWTATSNAGWITITSGASGSGNGSVGYSVGANSTTSPRTGTITIAGQTFTVTQSGTSCTYSISPTSTSVGATAATGSVSVTTGSGCSWTATSNAGWITITSSPNGSGSGSFGYSVAANTSASGRTGTIFIAGQTFTIAQAGTVCTYSLSPTSASFTAAGGVGSVSVTAAPGCTWTASSPVSWITITSGGSGSGNGTVTYSVAVQTSTSTRTRTITIAGQSFTITQAGVCSYSISPTSRSVGDAATTGTVSVTADAACSWTSTSQAGWITVTSGTTGTGSGSSSYAIAANTTTSVRTGILTIAGETFTVTQAGVPAQLPTLSASPATLTFGAVSSGGTLTAVTPVQVVVLTQVGTGTVTWTASADQPWIKIAGGAGTGTGQLTISLSNNGLPASGSATGTVTIAATGAQNSPRVSVRVNVGTPGTTSAPFGRVDTPVQGAKGVNGSIAVTGWALDDVGVSRVLVYRESMKPEPAGVEVYIGDAVLVDGARPDVEAAFPTMPQAGRAGWGYLLLTNMLPNRGNGKLTLLVYAEDFEGHRALLSSRSVDGDNATAVNPFGAIDTPAQGETVSGAAYLNFGWALTPQPKMIPFDSSTVTVVVDGVVVGHPSPLVARADIQALFPGYANTDNAVGAFVLDTTAYQNGVHTIAWVVVDDAGAADGIGSRYFTVFNGSGSAIQAGPSALAAPGSAPVHLDVQAPAIDYGGPVLVRRGVAADAAAESVPLLNGTRRITARQLERIVVELPPDGAPDRGGPWDGHLIVGAEEHALPVGSTFDARKGIFYWQPGAGFVGTYDLAFARTSATGGQERVSIEVVLEPLSRNESDVRMAVDLPVPGTVVQPFLVAGWAIDRGSVSGTGIDTVHVWAYPNPGSGEAPIFLGVARVGDARPDVGAYYGERFTPSSFGLVVSGLAPGTYDLAAFPYSRVTGGFESARVVRVTIR